MTGVRTTPYLRMQPAPFAASGSCLCWHLRWPPAARTLTNLGRFLRPMVVLSTCGEYYSVCLISGRYGKEGFQSTVDCTTVREQGEKNNTMLLFSAYFCPGPVYSRELWIAITSASPLKCLQPPSLLLPSRQPYYSSLLQLSAGQSSGVLTRLTASSLFHF